MANPKSKVLPQIFNVYLFVIVAHTIDVFTLKLKGDSTIFGTNLYGHVVAIMCVFVACLIKKKDIRAYGVNLRPKRIFKGLYRGAIFSLVPIAIVAGFFELIYVALGFDWAKVQFIPPNLNYSNGASVLKATAIYAVTIAISVFMKELFFRGYALRSARPVYQFFDANLIQAVLYIPIPIINHARNVLFNTYGDAFERLPFMIAVAVFYIVHEFMTGIKWGLLARVSGDIWLVFFDHYIYNFLAFSLLFSQSKISNWETMVKLMLVQIISFAMVWIYYKKKMAEREKLKLQKELAEIEYRQKHERGEEAIEGMNEQNALNAKSNEKLLDNFTKDSVQQKINEFSHANLHMHHGATSFSDDEKDDNLMDLKDININDFYREYAKEVERRTQNNKESVSQILESSDE
ncbi:MAG: CPBP family intramembrane metalloprotease [Clostridia bacterium]|nr:CPBP family intramembrane metalloprotease [Clostridia bacterium]